MAKNKSPKPEATTSVSGANPAMVIVDGKDISPEVLERLRAEPRQDVITSMPDANPLHALGSGRVSGVIVEDVAEGKHRVHVLERNEHGALVLWPVERGEVMPWHAARSVVEKVVETRLTPEDKR